MMLKKKEGELGIEEFIEAMKTIIMELEKKRMIEEQLQEIEEKKHSLQALYEDGLSTLEGELKKIRRDYKICIWRKEREKDSGP
jgi:DNA topoisomerase IA